MSTRIFSAFDLKAPHLRQLLLSILLATCLALPKANAQIYGAAGSSKKFSLYNTAANSWTAKTDIPAIISNGGGLAFDGTYAYCLRGSASSDIYKYTPSTDTWSAFTTPANVSAGGAIAYSNGNLYILRGTNNAAFYKYDIATSTWTTMTSLPASATTGGALTVNGSYIYAFQGGASGNFYRYDIAANTWSAMASTTMLVNAGGALVSAGNYIYGFRGDVTPTFSRYDIAANTWAAAPNAPGNVSNGGCLGYDGTYLYALSGSAAIFYRFDIAGNSWSTLASNLDNTGGGAGLVFNGTICSAPTFTAAAVQATCTGTTANSDAALQISAFTNAAKVGYSTGSTYSGPAFAGATTVGASPFTVVNTLANPASAQPYTIRVFCDAANYLDKVVTLQPKICSTANLSVTVSPPTDSGHDGETVSYTVTLTNAGPNPATGVEVKVPIISGNTFLSATPQQGTYNAGTQIWTVGTLAVGSKTMSLTLSVN